MYISRAFQNGFASQNISIFVGTSSVNVKKYISEKCKKRRIRIGEICFSWNFPKNHCKIANCHEIEVTRASIVSFTVCRSLNVGKCYAYTSKNQDQLIKKKYLWNLWKKWNLKFISICLKKLRPRINLANKNGLDSLLKMLSQYL